MDEIPRMRFEEVSVRKWHRIKGRQNPLLPKGGVFRGV